MRLRPLSDSERALVAAAVCCGALFLIVRLAQRPQSIQDTAAEAWDELRRGDCKSLYQKLWRKDIEVNGLTEEGFCIFVNEAFLPRYKRTVGLKQSDNRHEGMGQGDAGTTYISREGYDISTYIFCYLADGTGKIPLQNILESTYILDILEDGKPASLYQSLKSIERGYTRDRDILRRSGIQKFTLLDLENGTEQTTSIEKSLWMKREYLRTHADPTESAPNSPSGR